ncbi:MAG: glycosyltransferase, partial [Betaproteobacteria bacterium]|nr:glycosyltransferase [Betaproteobacteria bacterium]
AFACGLPVVARGVGGVVDLLGANERGLLVDKDPEQIAQALYDSFHGDPQERHARSERARRFVEEKYSVQGLVQSVKALYETPID